MTEITQRFMIRETLYLETLALHRITEFNIKVSNYNHDDLNFYLEDKFSEQKKETLEEYANMCGGESTLFMYYLYSGNDMPDLNLPKKDILSKIIRYPIVETIRYIGDND